MPLRDVEMKGMKNMLLLFSNALYSKLWHIPQEMTRNKHLKRYLTYKKSIQQVILKLWILGTGVYRFIFK